MSKTKTIDITNKNMLSPLGFQFNILRLPELNFFVQSVTLPGITAETLDAPTALKRVPTPSDKVDYSELEVVFKVDEDMRNYISVWQWIRGLGFPDENNQYRTLEQEPTYSGESVYSDATLTVYTSSMLPNIRIEINDLFPVSLTPIEMSAVNPDVEYIEATAAFRFLRYEFNRLGQQEINET